MLFLMRSCYNQLLQLYFFTGTQLAYFNFFFLMLNSNATRNKDPRVVKLKVRIIIIHTLISCIIMEQSTARMFHGEFSSYGNTE